MVEAAKQEEEKREVDNFALQCFKNCPQSYYWRVVRGLVKPGEKQIAAEFGLAIHAALEIYYSGGMTPESARKGIEKFTELFSKVEDLESRKHTVAKGVEILEKYFAHYANEPFEVIATEIGGAFELGDWIYKTRLDLVVRWKETGGVYVYDHKTSSSIHRLVVKPNAQLTGYIANLYEMYENVVGATLNIIGVYETEEVMDKSLPKVVNEKTGKPIYQKKKRQVFTRPTTTRTPKEIEDWKRETLYLLDIIEDCKKRNLWVKNTNHCSAYHSRCWYVDLCNAVSPAIVDRMVESGIYQVDFWQPYKDESD